jgi:2,4-dienoyl-CoA reductase (NADPH2)
MKRASCLVNPRAGWEKSLKITPVAPGKTQNIAVVGAGPAGLAFATTAAERGHKVTMFEKDDKIGGQFNMAKLVPGKEEFFESLKYFERQLTLTGVDVKLNTVASAETLNGYDSVVVATGVLPRDVKIPVKEGTTKVKVLSYVDVLRHRVPVGKAVAVIGAGGIGFDVSDFLTHPVPEGTKHVEGPPAAEIDEATVNAFLDDWGIDKSVSKGGLLSKESTPEGLPIPRKVYLLQRKEGKLGKGLGKTTGWIHRSVIKKRGVEEIAGT